MRDLPKVELQKVLLSKVLINDLKLKIFEYLEPAAIADKLDEPDSS